MKATLLFSLLLVWLTACVKENPMQEKEIETLKDISYGTDARQKMDIYLPAERNTSTTKTIVVIHGGGWTGGDKNEMVFAVDSLKKRLPGYAFININYRLAFNNTVNLFPTQENDVKEAIEFYLSRSAEYNISKDLVVVGASAGGHLALLHSYKNDPGRHVKAVVDYFGPTDLAALWDVGAGQQLILVAATGKLYAQDTALYFQSSPVNFITPQAPPTIVIQGGIDLLVPAAQSGMLIEKLEEKAVPNQLVYYPAGGHGDWPMTTYTDSFEKIQAFIGTHVH